MNLSATQNVETPVKYYRHAMLVLFFLLICRLVSMYFVPLNDSTEARYGEIARLMLETGNWVTPMHYYGVPFWAKPPLSTWLSAFSMQILGVSEFAARLPGILLSIGVLWLVWNLAKKRSGSLVAMTAVLVLAGSLYFILDSGAVMTDPSLLFCTTLILVSFWQAVVTHHKRWGYAFFVGMGLGLLAKGPVALVLTGMPLFIWVCWQKQWTALWKRLPWITGSSLMLVIALPWYLLAEARTPGFINYFIVGEHIQRFLQPGWTGDKYGFAHIAPYGMIWVYAFLGILPWSIIGIAWLIRHAKQVPSLCKDNDGWLRYLLLCTVVPLLFFTFASNIIYPYVFPSLPTFALLFAELANRAELTTKNQQRFITLAAVNGCVFLVATMLFIWKPEWVAKSHDRLITVYQNQHPSPQSNLIFWYHKAEYSALFYSAGKIKATLDEQELCQLLSNHNNNYLVLASDERVPLPEKFKPHLTKVKVIPVLKNKFTLYQTDVFQCENG
jgi:4-amino-4-deoxy-L-arabinose transferase-like glycosyltransferase